MRLMTLFLLIGLLWAGIGSLSADTLPAPFAYEVVAFETMFPNGIAIYLNVTPTDQLASATMFLTMDGTVIFSDEVTVPEHEAGQLITLRGAWDGRVASGDPCPPWAYMQIWWRLIDEEGNAIYTPQLREQYRDVNRAWQHTPGTYASAYTYDQVPEVGTAAAHWGDNAYLNLQARYGYDLPYRPVLVFYNNPADGAFDLGYTGLEPFAQSVYARTYPGTNTMITLTSGGYDEMQRVIPHEMAHLYQLQMGSLLFDAPLWWIEGDARAQEPSEQRRLVMENVLRYASSQPLPLLVLWDSQTPDPVGFDLMMDIGASFVLYLEEQYGAEGHARFYEGWHITGKFDSAFFWAFSKTLAELELEWRVWLTEYEFR